MLTLVLVLVDEDTPLLLACRALHGLLVDLEDGLGVGRLCEFWEGGLEVFVHLIVESAEVQRNETGSASGLSLESAHSARHHDG